LSIYQKNMSTLAMAWEAFISALAEARALHRSGASVTDLVELMRHADELLDIIDEELSMQPWTVPAVQQATLNGLRAEVQSVRRGMASNLH
jgi:hypothetical protein